MKAYVMPTFINKSTNKITSFTDENRLNIDENFIQDLCFSTPSVVPVAEIEPIYSGLIPLCRELKVPSGRCDDVFINDEGFLTIIECKLWKNPEAKREVVAQVIDYAKDLASFDYEKLQENVLKARKGNEKSLIDIVKNYSDVSEYDFIDKVNNHLKNGEFLLLILGDKIKDNIEKMVDFFHKYTKMSFTLALLELDLFKIPETENIIVIPNCLAKTRPIYLNILENENAFKGLEKIETSTEKTFYDRLIQNCGIDCVNKFNLFVDSLITQYGFVKNFGRGKTISLNLKNDEETVNFFSVLDNGTVSFYGLIAKTHSEKDLKKGKEYIESISKMLNANWNATSDFFHVIMTKNNKNVSLADFTNQFENIKEFIKTYLEN